MLEKFRQTIQEHRLCKPEHKILLAVSGGIDSMVMMHLYQQLGKFRLAVAHCNFQLRGEESQGDLEFVREEAEKSGLKFLSTNFHTREYAAENKLSIQMAARDLRYSWFLQLAEEHAFHRVALAHNLDDIIETTLINLARGTGLKGLTGIKPISGIFIRPLLFASREDISCYAKNNGIRYREDSSNAETKYKRNLIRHKIMPLLEQLNPSIRETFQQETEIFHATWDLYHQEIERLKKKILLKKGRRQLVKITSIKEEEISAPLLFEILSDARHIFGEVHLQTANWFPSINGPFPQSLPEAGKSASISRRLTSLRDRLCDVPRYASAQSLDLTLGLSAPRPCGSAFGGSNSAILRNSS